MSSPAQVGSLSQFSFSALAALPTISTSPVFAAFSKLFLILLFRFLRRTWNIHGMKRPVSQHPLSSRYAFIRLRSHKTCSHNVI
jgi:hypothetical protein